MIIVLLDACFGHIHGRPSIVLVVDVQFASFLLHITPDMYIYKFDAYDIA